MQTLRCHFSSAASVLNEVKSTLDSKSQSEIFFIGFDTGRTAKDRQNLQTARDALCTHVQSKVFSLAKK